MVTLTKYCFLLSNQRVAGSGFGELASQAGGRQRARTLSKLSGKMLHAMCFVAVLRQQKEAHANITLHSKVFFPAWAYGAVGTKHHPLQIHHICSKIADHV